MEVKKLKEKIVNLSTDKKEVENLLSQLEVGIENKIIADCVYIMRKKDVVEEFVDKERNHAIYSGLGDTMFSSAGLKVVCANSMTLGGLLASIAYNKDRVKSDEEFDIGYQLIVSVLKNIGIIYENGENLNKVANIMNDYLKAIIEKSEILNPTTLEDELQNETFEQGVREFENSKREING